MKFKRKGPKSTRAGCLLCKSHKRQGTKRSERQRYAITKRMVIAQEKIKDGF